MDESDSALSSTQQLHHHAPQGGNSDSENHYISHRGDHSATINNIASTMNFFEKRVPLLKWGPTYKLSYLFKDILAGFTVALTEIPQGIAYAKVAGLDPVYGLYSGFMGCFMYFIFGSCKDLNIGPTSILALMVQSHVSNLGPAMAVLSTFTTGCIIFLLGLFNLGFLVEFFSYPVIAGFTSAGSLQIAATQLNSLFGINQKASAFLEAWIKFFENLDQIQWTDTTLGILSIIFLVILREFRKFGSLKYRPELSMGRNVFAITSFLIYLSRNALVVIIGTLLAYILEDADGKSPFGITGTIGRGIPSFELPPFSTDFNGTHYEFTDMIQDMGTSLIFAPLVAILETVAIAKAFSGGKSLDATQEMFAVGACNVMGSFVKSMPVTGSFTRTAVNNASGVVTTFGGVITGLCVLLALSFLTSTFYYIPKATLASVVICAMFYLFDYESFYVLWKNKKIDMIPLLATFLAGLFWSLENGILIGIGCNLMFILYSSARPKFYVDQQTILGKCVYVISPKNSIHFPAAEHLRRFVQDNCCLENITVVINGKNLGNMDVTIGKSFIVLKSEMKFRHQELLFIHLKPSIKNILLGLDPSISENIVDGPLETVIKNLHQNTECSSVASIT